MTSTCGAIHPDEELECTRTKGNHEFHTAGDPETGEWFDWVNHAYVKPEPTKRERESGVRRTLRDMVGRTRSTS